MKKLLSIATLVALAQTSVHAQATFNTLDSVDINNVTANMLVHGDMMWNPVDYATSGCQYPAHSGKFINFTTALWISGYDASNNLHIAAQTYRQAGNDFWPGPLDGGDTLTYPTSYFWAKIWKVNRTDIEYFNSLTTHTVANTPQAILTWPGKGSEQAQGNAGSTLTIDHDMAPFIDLNGNGIYEPLLGDYPAIKGDQALWWVFSDNGPTHTETKGRPLGVEVHAMAFGYRRNTLIDNVVYIDYTVVNRSANDYSNVRMAFCDDVQIGWFGDDYIGFDSSRRMAITYNASNDDGASGGSPGGSYGTHPPQSGLTMIKLPGDIGSSYVPAGSFGYINNDATVLGNPTADTEYNNYMRAKNRGGQHFIQDTTGSLTPSGPDCNYLYTGDLSSATQWSECSLNDVAGDRRVVLSGNDFSLPAGASQHMVVAFVVADTAGGCGHASFSDIKTVADTAWADYYNPPAPNAVKNVVQRGSVAIYPNPAHDNLFIENNGVANPDEYIAVFNAIGQVMNVTVKHSGSRDEINISQLPEGLYYVKYSAGGIQKTEKFLKK